MTEELRHRREGRLMREHGIRVVKTQKYKAMTAGDIFYTSEGWLYLAVSNR